MTLRNSSIMIHSSWAKSICFWLDFTRNISDSGEIYLFLVGFRPKCALWGGGGDKMPCMRMAPGGWPLSNRWYLPAERAKRVQQQAPPVS